ncbi:Deacetylase [Candidatus Syntrophocurvum alkaliphilum]|uniref:Deacetylase n=1 Tax=Candidatus Syntrophocurvum alkaliphilum TaxID=2293317 RepID=A0A6I6D9C5_9FIRM|nr:histone deacetylase family protein [Candidatus Syntrophocurvum alkaliphilum]QGT99445.1 Deacetylase [Candidatus Syntrophocurvum alkaliphilum]
MKVIFDELFFHEYSLDSAADMKRLDHAYDLLSQKYEIIKPELCTDEDILLVHTEQHLKSIKSNKKLYETAKMAVGSAILAAEYAIQNQMAFALCRPPGHHASSEFCWGFCYFNNIAIAVQNLLENEYIENAIIIDIDLHLGDGTYETFKNHEQVEYYHIKGRNSHNFIKELEDYLENKTCDIIAISAGFDRHEYDWGGMLPTTSYNIAGQILGKFTREKCQGGLFAVLEGGYNPVVLGESILAFLEGLEK